MSALQTPWRASGLSAIVGGSLLAAGWLLNVPRVTLPGEIAILFAHGFLILGVVGLYARQANESGKLGLCGLALAVLGGSTMIPGGAYYASLIPHAAEAISAATEHGIGGGNCSRFKKCLAPFESAAARLPFRLTQSSPKANRRPFRLTQGSPTAG